ncbi:MAG: HlyD family efflux transporter periplasmic adaptor subunit [Pseudomonadota bacterium]
MTEQKQNQEFAAVSKLLQLESMARSAISREALSFMIVNETRRLIPYRQAYLFLSLHPIQRDCELAAASSVAVVDDNAPFVDWLHKLKAQLFNSETIAKQHQLDESLCPDNLKSGWQEYSLPFVLWTPLKLPDGTFIGGVWMTRETPWKDNEQAMLRRLGETYAHAMVAVTSRRMIYKRPKAVKIAIFIIILFMLAVLAKPVQLTALAPAKIVAIDPKIVSAPMDGVIKQIFFPPNTRVSVDEVLFKLEDSELKNEYEVAEKTLAVAEAELRKVSQDAFQDTKSKSQVALLQAEANLQKTKLNYSKELLDRVNVKAQDSGLLIYTDKSDWIGRPVKVGERIMEIADPNDIQVQVNLAVDDSIVLAVGAKTDLFLDADPLNPVLAEIISSSYLATNSEKDIMSYRLYARFDETVELANLRIGLQGTAKVYGEKVSLFFYLFRRPISAARQYLGI